MFETLFSRTAPAASTDLPIERVRYALQMRPLTVQAVEQLTPHIRRLRLHGPSLADFESRGFDDHVKLLGRDYTPRRFNRAERTLEIDFCLHGDGPAASWAAQAKVGDALTVGGPRGSMLVPTDLAWQWLIGDESALPAIARRLEELPASVAIRVVLETASTDEALPPLALGDNVQLLRVARPAQGDAAALAAPLVAAVRSLPTPSGRGHVFAAGEGRSIQAVREVLVSQHGLAKGQIRAAAYWQRGRSGHHERLEG
jgi:NADPH-dependent ferric siderophore reductase